MTASASVAVRRHILPPQSTELERAIDETMPQWDAIAGAFTPPSVGEPEGFAPWLAAEYALTEFAPYFATTAELLAEGRQWLFVRGTAASVMRALRWVGFPGAVIQEEGAYLHIELGRIATAEEMRRVAHVVRASVPAHVAFYRVFHGYDLRPIVLDRGPALDAGMLDGYSGVLGESGVVESYGARAGGTLPALPSLAPAGATTQVRMSVSRYDDMPVLDAWRLDSRVLSGLSGGVMELTTFTSNAPTPGGGARAQTTARASVAAWTAPAPVGALQSITFAQAATPVHPPRRWGGVWGGRWREHFQLIHTEEP